MKRSKINLGTAFLFLLCNCSLYTQSNSGLFFEKITGVDLSNRIHVESPTNTLFHDLCKSNAPSQKVGLPFIGDFHFNNYAFVDDTDNIFKYNYFLTTADLYPSLFLFDNKNSSANIRLTFGLKIRVWNKRRYSFRTQYGPSHVIKTPSYLPGIYYSRIIKSKTQENVRQLQYLEIGFTHHSNGQDAPTLLVQDSTLTIPGNLKYNIEDGDFSANNLSIGYSINTVHFSKYKQLHSVRIIFDGLDAQKYDHDDLHRYRILYTFHHGIFSKLKYTESASEKHRMALELGLGMRDLSSFSIDQALVFKVEYNYRIDFLENIYLLLEYNYLGQDDYNIYLENSIHHFRIGFSSFLSLKY